MADQFAADSVPMLPTMPVEPHAARMALRVVLVSFAVFVLLAPFARTPLRPLPAFIPAYESALLINDLVTAVMLSGHFLVLRSRALLVLACGYFFTAMITIPHAMTFPGLLAPGGLLGAGSQSTAWLYVFWHAGFPLCIIAYARVKRHEDGAVEPVLRPLRALVCAIGAVFAAVAGFTWIATAGHDALPAIMNGAQVAPPGNALLTLTWIVSALALLSLWRRKSASLLDLWLAVVMCAWLFDIALSAVINAGRYDLGWYAGRIYGLLAASCVLIILLLENTRLYARLIGAHEHALRRGAQSRALNLQNEARACQYAEALAELHCKEQEVRAIVQNISDGVITVDARGVVRSANPALERIFGFPAGAVAGVDVTTLIPAFWEHRASGHAGCGGDAQDATIGGQAEGVHRDGRAIPLELAVNDFVVHGEYLFVGAVRDISERAMFISQLEQARIAADRANDAKSAFLASMSHELRTPLNAILGFSHILASLTVPLSPEKRREFTLHILNAGKHLLVLINDVLDLAKVEAGTVSLTIEAVALGEVMLACQELIKALADERAIRITIAPDHDVAVLADRVRLRQVLLNLLSNAVKYNRHGGAVIVGICAGPSGAVRITVQDHGQGLDPDQLTQLFQPFNRLGQEANGVEGTGIGLVLTKRLVELMGGSMGVTSVVGAGSMFWLQLPVAAAGRAAARAA